MSRIVGGENASQGSWGWAVSILVQDGHFCVGTILNEWYVITAAHCLADHMHQLSLMTVCAGTNRLSEGCRQHRLIRNVINHPGYNRITTENDIALIRVHIPFDFTDKLIARICLPDAIGDKVYPPTNADVVAVGWGKTETNPRPDILQQVTIQVVDKFTNSCKSTTTNHGSQLCASAADKGKTLLFNHLFFISLFVSAISQTLVKAIVVVL
jgi:secreted trypsin-like serine protease